MKRLLVFCFCLPLIGTADAVPARPLYEPPAPEAPPAFQFAGTRWFGKTYEGNDWTLILDPNGSVTNIDGPNTYAKSGFWKANGNNFYMELNQKYYQYHAKLLGDTLQGDSSNVAGLKWKTNFHRIGGSK